MKKLLVLFFLVGAIYLFGCSDDNGTNPDDETVYIWPLAVGNQWVFQTLTVDSLGDTINFDTIDVYIYSDTVLENHTWYATADIVPIQWSFYVTNKSDGFWSDASAPYLEYKFPASAGDTWTNDESHVTHKLTTKNVNITVPRGTYSCYRYSKKMAGLSDSTAEYLSPGTGLIKLINWSETSKETYYMELIGLTLH